MRGGELGCGEGRGGEGDRKKYALCEMKQLCSSPPSSPPLLLSSLLSSSPPLLLSSPPLLLSSLLSSSPLLLPVARLIPLSLLSLYPLLPSPHLPCNHYSSIYSLVSAALGSQIKVADRPVTQQGLGGMKTGARGRNNSFSPLIFVYILCLK